MEVRQAYKYTRAGGYAEAAVDNVFLMLNTAGEVAIRENGIVNAATGVPGAVAPGEMITVYTTGVNLAGTARMQLNTDGYISTNIGQAKLYFDGVEAPMLSVNSSQIGAIVPWQVDGKGTSVVRVEYQGVTSPSVAVSIVPTAPGIFTADGSPKGQGLIYNDGFLPNGEATPVAPGGLATIIWTGGGVTDPAGMNGRIDFNPLPRVVAPVKVIVGGQEAEVLFAGAIPYGWSGLLSAVVKVPAGLATDKPISVPVVITAGDSSSPDAAVTMWVKP